ncbi:MULTISPECIES: PD-(D/E)XK nuclease-like domain-containing protein [unclassified Streptomyces]|uniref:PD-(D/E)XK nuclease-like domain-containing protein n=1 Tax=Streptomyces sp. NPDC127129 TaxID=3345373 RepID=UPI00362A5B35
MSTTQRAGASAPAVGPIEPGLYPDLSAEAYHADRASLSSSGARKILDTCAALFRYEQDHPQPPKKTFDFGHAAHREVLGDGPELVVIDAPRWDTNELKAEVAAARAAGAVPLKQHEYDQVQDMAAAIRRHPQAAALFAPGSGRPELSGFWTDGPTGVTRRVRFDWMPNRSPGRLIIPDYKTCVSAAHDDLEKAMASYGYHQQAEWYRTGATALGLGDETTAFVFVCQEKTPPYLVTVFQPSAVAMRIAAAKNRRALQVFAECVESDRWPAYSDDVAYLSLPPWAEKRETEEYL